MSTKEISEKVYENGQKLLTPEVNLKTLTDEEFLLLQEACRLHTVELKTGNPTIDACFDADRLDLWRVGIAPDPNRLATKKGKEIARNTDYEPLIYKAIWEM